MEVGPSSPVLVGLLDQAILDPLTVGWDTSRVGGLPTWLGLETSRPVPECKNCGQASSLVAQIYCPLGGSAYHRCLYLFVCPGGCTRQQNGWRVFRSMKHDSNYQPHSDHTRKSTHPTSECLDEIWDQQQNDWGDEADDWGDHPVGCKQDPDDWSEDSVGEETHEESCDLGKAVDNLGQAEVSACGQTGHDCVSAVNLEVVGNHVTKLDLQKGVLDSPIISLGLEALSQLTLADDVVQSSELPSGDRVTTSIDGCEDAEVPLEVETMGLADAQRWDAMTKLLNTKLVQDTESAISTSKSNVVFEPYFLSVFDEPADAAVECDHLNDLIRSYERSEGKQLHLLLSGSPKTSKEKDKLQEIYERTELKHGDKMFHKFLKRLQRCPQQCIRYERGGNPLLVSHLSGEPVSVCPYCQGRRIFELQFLPQLIPFLKAKDGTPCEVEFGTVLVFTCERNCWPADLDPASKLDLLEEYIILQGDPDIHLYS